MTIARSSASRSGRRLRRRASFRNEKSLGTCVIKSFRQFSPFKHGSSKSSSFRNHSKQAVVERTEALQGENVPKEKMSMHVSETVTSMFDYVFEGASLLRIPIEQCISLEELRGRSLTESGVKRFEHIINGGAIGTVTGHIAVGRKPIVTALPEAYEVQIRKFFLDRGRESETVEEWCNKRTMYHVIDGTHELMAQWRHNEKNGYTFCDRGWWAICIEWQSPSILKGISRMANSLQKKEFVVDYTTADQILSFREAMEDVATKRNIIIGPGKPLPSGFVAKSVSAFAGGASYANQTLSNLGPVVARMSMRLARSLKRVLDEELPDVAEMLAAKKKSNKMAEDARVFRKLINTQNIRCVKKFLAVEVSDEDRENVLFRLCHEARDSGNYKGVSPQKWDEQTVKAIAAKEEVTKFKRMLGGDKIPESVANRIKNMLTTTDYDKDIEDQKYDEGGLLSALTDAYIRDGGNRAATRIEQYVRKLKESVHNQGHRELHPSDGTVEADKGSEQLKTITRNDQMDDDAELFPGEATLDQDDLENLIGNSDATDHDNAGSEKVDEQPTKPNVGAAGEECTPCTSTEEHQEGEDEVQVTEPDFLSVCNVQAFNESWVDFMRSRMSEEGIFNFILIEPFQRGARYEPKHFDDDYIGKLGSFIRKALTPDGFCFAILLWNCLGQWKSVFESRDLAFYSIFRLGFESSSLQRIKGKDIRDPFEDALVFRRHTKRKASIKVNYPYSVVSNCSYSRRFAIIDQIPATSRLTFRGSKMQVRTTEKAPALYWELLRTFCPPGGKVLDIFAGPMACGIACIKSFRPCVLLEEDKMCFELAVNRLKKFGKERVEKKDPVSVEDLQNSEITGTEGETLEWKEEALEELQEGESSDSMPPNSCSNESYSAGPSEKTGQDSNILRNEVTPAGKEPCQPRNANHSLPTAAKTDLNDLKNSGVECGTREEGDPESIQNSRIVCSPSKAVVVSEVNSPLIRQKLRRVVPSSSDVDPVTPAAKTQVQQTPPSRYPIRRRVPTKKAKEGT